MRLPWIQFAIGSLVILCGAYLIGKWAVGIALAVIGLCMVFDALLRDIAPQQTPPTVSTFEEVIERARNSR